ncbi:MAG: sigma-70 family RNA polymerase sigma factor [Phycisphaerales bacterium]|nr:sigma-70 family RNA polymerase sigma factor [Phycisphaerales bacterium]
MVTAGAKPNPCDGNLDPLNLRPISDRRARTVQAARKAIAVVKQLESGNTDGLDEMDLFAAFQVSAFRASRQPRGTRVPVQTRCCWARRWKVLRDELVDRNLGLVYTMITRFNARELDWEDQRSEALYALLRAVDGYNPWSGFRFSTYACNAITRALIQLSKRTLRYRSRYPLEHESWRERPPRVDVWAELFADRLHRALDHNLGDLTDREAAVLGWRFPMKGGRSLTLGEVGAAIGLSKERARQIQEEALGKLRDVLVADPALE